MNKKGGLEKAQGKLKKRNKKRKSKLSKQLANKGIKVSESIKFLTQTFLETKVRLIQEIKGSKA